MIKEEWPPEDMDVLIWDGLYYDVAALSWKEGENDEIPVFQGKYIYTDISELYRFLSAPVNLLAYPLSWGGTHRCHVTSIWHRSFVGPLLLSPP